MSQAKKIILLSERSRKEINKKGFIWKYQNPWWQSD